MLCNRFLISLIDYFLVCTVVIFPIFPAILQCNGKISVLPAARCHGLWSNLPEDDSKILWKAFQYEYASRFDFPDP